MNAILLAGAALVGLPVLLHLIMKQEPKRLTFPAYRFLKQRLKTNQRKLRLRHFLLLALRMLLIALFTLTLYQPSLKSDAVNLRGEQPVAVVLVIDTSPSMGYVLNGQSRLDEARGRALELLNDLPDKSPVAILDTSDLSAVWLPDAGAARRRLEELKETRGAGQPVTSAVAVAYQLLAKVESENETENLQKLVAVFTDRTAGSWDGGRVDELKKLRELIPDPKPSHVVFDFGADQPSNVSVLSVEIKPQVIPAGTAAQVTVTVAAVGAANEGVEAVVQPKPTGAAKADTALAKPVVVPNGQTRTLGFELRDLKPGLNQWEFGLKTPDNLAFDNTRYLTFQVGASRRILTITSDPKGAVYWQAAHLVKGEFDCLVVTPDALTAGAGGETVVRYAPDSRKPNEVVTDDLRNFQVVCLLAVSDPSAPDDKGVSLWDRLRPYLRTGGKLIVAPGRDTFTRVDGYNAATDDLMPGKLGKVLDTRRMDPAPPPQTAPTWDEPRDGKNGVTWFLDEAALKHPLVKPIDDARQQKGARLDVLANPRRVTKYWDVTRDPAAAAVAFYYDAEKNDGRRPAVLERPVLDPNDGNRPKGKVVLLTTRLDVTGDDADRKDYWHDYWNFGESSWYALFPNLLARYLAGDVADASFNHPTGATVVVPLPRGKLPRDGVVLFDGPPGVIVGNDATIRPGDKQTELRLGPPKTNAPGNYALSIGDPPVWRDGFALNVPPEESNLAKVDVKDVEELAGEGKVIAVTAGAKGSPLRELIATTIGGQVDLFPWLLIAVLLGLVLEGFIANRFYRRVR